MSVLNREEFFAKLNTLLSEDTSDESIAILEDMTDTYNDMERKANGDGVDWEAKYKELDETWKKRYRHRFFSGGSNTPETVIVDGEQEEYTPESVKIDDLFEEKEEK